MEENASVQIIPNASNGNFAIQLRLPDEAMATKLSLYNSFGKRSWEQNAGNLKSSFHKNI